MTVSSAHVLDDVLRKRAEIQKIAARHGVTSISVFGSVARREELPESDIDFLIDVEKPLTPWFPGGLIADLEVLLGRAIDIVESRAIYPPLREHILADVMKI